jgi:hypothetical protein
VGTRRERRNIHHELWVNSLPQRKIVGNAQIYRQLQTFSVDAKLPKNFQWVFLDPGPCAMRGPFFQSPEIAVLYRQTV